MKYYILNTNEHIKKLIKHISIKIELGVMTFSKLNKYLIELGIELKILRMTSKQTLQNNITSSDQVDHTIENQFAFHTLDSLVNSLNDIFAEYFEKLEMFSIHTNI